MGTEATSGQESDPVGDWPWLALAKEAMRQDPEVNKITARSTRRERYVWLTPDRSAYRLHVKVQFNLDIGWNKLIVGTSDAIVTIEQPTRVDNALIESVLKILKVIPE